MNRDPPEFNEIEIDNTEKPFTDFQKKEIEKIKNLTFIENPDPKSILRLSIK